MGHEPRLSTSGGGGGSKEGFFCFSLPVESGPSALLLQVETLVYHREDAGGESYCSLHCQAVLGANGASRLVASGGPLLGASKKAPTCGEQDEGDPTEDIYGSVYVLADKRSELQHSLAHSLGCGVVGWAGTEAQEECSSRGPPGTSVFYSGYCL